MFDVHCFISPFGKIHCCVVSVASCVVSVVLCRLCCIGYREFLRWSKFIFQVSFFSLQI